MSHFYASLLPLDSDWCLPVQIKYFIFFPPAHQSFERPLDLWPPARNDTCRRWSHFTASLRWSFVIGMAPLTKSGQVSVTEQRRFHRPSDTSVSVWMYWRIKTRSGSSIWILCVLEVGAHQIKRHIKCSNSTQVTRIPCSGNVSPLFSQGRHALCTYTPSLIKAATTSELTSAHKASVGQWPRVELPYISE